jgi:hypothetical protein
VPKQNMPGVDMIMMGGHHATKHTHIMSTTFHIMSTTFQWLHEDYVRGYH